MKKTKSSRAWLNRQAKDPYVKRRNALGLRSRAVFKLEEMQQKTRFIRKGMVVVDLGAAPGGWAMQAQQWVGEKGRVIAVDCLAMAAIPQVDIIQGDFTTDATLKDILSTLGIACHDVAITMAADKQYAAVNVVLSDMAPNLSGVVSVDQPKSLYLAQLAWDFAAKVLRPNGHFVVKVFQGSGVDEFLRVLRSSFQHVSMRKPAASRVESREMYVFASGFKSEV